MQASTLRLLARIGGLSLLVLVPCFWHSRIQSGDLSSHAYNAWLTGQVMQQPVHGLAIVPQHSNVLFDLLLWKGMGIYDANSAQRIVVAVCVLLFFWGGFALVRAAAGRAVWWISPCLAMLSYGWVFHMGLFNFYLSQGLCLLALSLWFTGPNALRLISLVLLGVAWTAHPLPVLWAIGVAIAMRVAKRYPYFLLPVGVMALFATHFVIASQYVIRWSWNQKVYMTGADQLIPFGTAYLPIAMCALILAGTVIWQRARRSGWLELLRSPETQVLGLLSAAILAMPSAIQVADYQMPLEFLPQRMSLTVALMACVVMARGPIARWQASAWWVLLVAYGFLLHGDTFAFNRLEDAVTTEISRFKPGQRVIIAAGAPETRVNLLTHMVDRACIGHCFSYANYEPCTLQFRLKATDRNDVVTASCETSVAMQSGTYVVEASDPALVQINICSGNRIKSTQLHPGQVAGRPACH